MLQCVNPPGLARPQTYTHVIVATGSQLVFIAGQVAEDARGTLVGGSDRQADLPLIEEARAAIFGDHKPVDTLIGVQALAHPGCLIEVEATAVVEEVG